jgi:hypothetical protein
MGLLLEWTDEPYPALPSARPRVVGTLTLAAREVAILSWRVGASAPC